MNRYKLDCENDYECKYEFVCEFYSWKMISLENLLS